MKIEFTAYGEAKPAGSKTGFVVKTKSGKSRAVVVDACKTTKPWQAVVSSSALEAIKDCGETPRLSLFDSETSLVVDMRFFIPRPAGHYFKTGKFAGQKKSQAREYPCVRPDVLKLARAVEDAMTGIVYRDDSQIVQEHISKHYGEPARVEVTISTLEN